LIVGTILSAINQGGVILDHSFTAKDFIRVIMNYLIPLAVATYSRLALIKELENNEPNDSTNRCVRE